MSGKLLQEIHKTQPFESVRQEALLNVIRTADHLMRGFEELLKPLNLSATQYNVLRILRGAPSGGADAAGESCGGANGDGHAHHGKGAGEAAVAEGVSCKTIGEHMITRDPDITRLLDRLEARGLITRRRDTRDRRVVTTCITAEGLKLLKELDAPVHAFHAAQFPNMSEGKLDQLIDLLEQARGK